MSSLPLYLYSLLINMPTRFYLTYKKSKDERYFTQSLDLKAYSLIFNPNNVAK